MVKNQQQSADMEYLELEIENLKTTESRNQGRTSVRN